MAAKAIFFDCANTLLHKPDIYPAILRVLADHNITIPEATLVHHHRLLSEAILFPDRTSRDFYLDFNAHLLRAFGVLPEARLLDALFDACSYLPWKAFPDTDFLSAIELPMGVLSNWDTSLDEKLGLLNARFNWVLGSDAHRLRKPDPAFFLKAIEAAGVEASTLIYVGDSLRLDIEPAKQLGIQAILIDRDNLYPHSTASRIKSLHELGGLLERSQS